MKKRTFNKRYTALSKATNRIAEQLEPDQDELVLSRIETVTRSARTQWYLMLSISAYCLVTVMSVEHADFFVSERKTTLPLLAVDIPTLSFFGLSSLLVAALSFTYHLAVQKVWYVFSQAPANPRGRPLGAQAHPWIVNDLVLLMLKDEAIRKQPFHRLAALAAGFLTWAIAPLTLSVLWWESMPARMEWITLGIFFALVASAFVSLQSYFNFRSAILASATSVGWRHKSIVTVSLIFLTAVSWARTEGHITFPKWDNDEEPYFIGTLLIFPEPVPNNVRYEAEKYFFDQQSPVKRFIASHLPFLQDLFFLAPLDLTRLNSGNKPLDWLSVSDAENVFFQDFCTTNRYDNERCGLVQRFASSSGFDLARRQKEWCTENSPDNANCFNDLQWRSTWYRSEWSVERSRQRSAIEALDLRGADLRWADLTGAFLTNADLSRARLSFSILANANFEGGLLHDTSFVGSAIWSSQFSYSNGEDSLFHLANIQGADFSHARMRGYDFYEATIVASRFGFSDLLGAKFWNSTVRATEFDQALLMNSRWADAEITSGTIIGTNLAYANGINQTQLDAFIGDEETKLMRSRDNDAPQLRVGKCWSDNDEFVRIYRPTSTLGLASVASYVFPGDWLCDGTNRLWIEASIEPVDEFKDTLLFSGQRVWMFSQELSQ